MWLLAQMVPDLGGTALTGWGAFALAVAILAWLAFWHLPAKDKQIDQMIEDKDLIVSDLLKTYNARLDAKDVQITAIVTATVNNDFKARDDFRASLDKVINHCSEENHRARDSWVKNLDPIIRQVVRDVMKEEINSIPRK